MRFDELTPEDAATLVNAIKQKFPELGGGGGDNQAEENGRFQALEEAVELLQGLYKQTDEKVDLLVSFVQDGLIGPIEEENERGRRMNGIKDISDKYGDRFGKYKDFYGSIADGRDIFEALFDHLEERRGKEPEWNEDRQGSILDELESGLKSKMEGVKGSFGKEEPKPELTVEKVTAEPDTHKEMVDMVAKMKSKGLPRGMGN